MCGGLFASFIILICGQFDILYANLKNLGEVTAENISKRKEIIRESQKNFNVNDEFLNFGEKADHVDDIAVLYNNEKEAMSECVKHHKMILEMCGMLQDVYSIFSSAKLFYSSKFLDVY